MKRSRRLSFVFVSAALLAAVFAPASAGAAPKRSPAAEKPGLSRAALRSPDAARAASELDLGWKAIIDWQPEAAIGHFNKASASGQASYRLAWGFGLAYGELSKFPESVRWFERASEQYANNGRLLSDFGFTYMSWGLFLSRTGTKPVEKADATRYFDAAETHFQDALRLASGESVTYTRLAMLNYYRGRYDAAWKYVKQSKKLGGEDLDTQFIKDLAAHKPEPK